MASIVSFICGAALQGMLKFIIPYLFAFLKSMTSTIRQRIRSFMDYRDGFETVHERVSVRRSRNADQPVTATALEWISAHFFFRRRVSSNHGIASATSKCRGKNLDAGVIIGAKTPTVKCRSWGFGGAIRWEEMKQLPRNFQRSHLGRRDSPEQGDLPA